MHSRPESQMSSLSLLLAECADSLNSCVHFLYLGFQQHSKFLLGNLGNWSSHVLRKQWSEFVARSDSRLIIGIHEGLRYRRKHIKGLLEGSWTTRRFMEVEIRPFHRFWKYWKSRFGSFVKVKIWSHSCNIDKNIIEPLQSYGITPVGCRGGSRYVEGDLLTFG